MSNFQKGFAPIYIIILILVIGIIVGIYFFGKTAYLKLNCPFGIIVNNGCGWNWAPPLSSTQPSSMPTPTTISTVAPKTDETTNWKTYSNTQYGVSFKYPNNWYIKDYVNQLSDPNDVFIEFFEKGTSPVEGEGVGTTNYMIAFSIGKSEEPFSSQIEYQKLGINDVKDFMIGGKKAVKYPSTYFLEGWEYNILLDSSKNMILHFKTRTTQTVSDQILSTFKFN